MREKIQRWPKIQVEAYKNVLERAQGKTEWLALIDTDEFILVRKDENLDQCLKTHYPEADAVFAQWLVFGTNGVTLSKNDSMLEKMTACARWEYSWHNVGKTLIRPEKADFKKMWSVHHLPLVESGRWFNGSGQEIFMKKNDFCFTSHQGEYLRINHYFFRDEKFFQEVKMPRKVRSGVKLDELRYLYEECSLNQNTEILKKWRFEDS